MDLKQLSQAMFGGRDVPSEADIKRSDFEQAIQDVLAKDGKSVDLSQYLGLLFSFFPNMKDQLGDPKDLFAFVHKVESRYNEITGVDTTE